MIPYLGDLMGMPYMQGGRRDDAAFDCVGLVLAVLERAGAHASDPQSPESWEKQEFVDVPVSAESLRPLDVVHFLGEDNGLGHMGIYLAGGLMIHAPETGVRVDRIDMAKVFAITRWAEWK